MKIIRVIVAFSLLMLSIANECSARKHKPFRTTTERFVLYNWVKFRVTPTGLVNRFGIGLPIGGEFFLDPNFSLTADVSIPFLTYRNNSKVGLYEKNIKTELRLNAQARYYFGRGRQMKWMCGYEFFYEHQKFAEQYGQYHDLNGGHSFLSADVNKKIFGVGSFFGFNLHLAGDLCLESRVGMGLKWANVKRENIVGLAAPHKLYGFFPSNEDELVTNTAVIYFPASISLTYGIGKRKH